MSTHLVARAVQAFEKLLNTTGTSSQLSAQINSGITRPSQTVKSQEKSMLNFDLRTPDHEPLVKSQSQAAMIKHSFAFLSWQAPHSRLSPHCSNLNTVLCPLLNGSHIEFVSDVRVMVANILSTPRVSVASWKCPISPGFQILSTLWLGDRNCSETWFAVFQ